MCSARNLFHLARIARLAMLSAALTCSLVNPSAADDPVFASKDANDALSAYHKDVSKLDTAYKGKLADCEARYNELKKGHLATLISKLESAKAEAAKAVKLDEANKLQQAIDKFKQEGPPESEKKGKKRDLKSNTPENRAAFEKMIVGTHWIASNGDAFGFKADNSANVSWHGEPTLWVVIAPYQVRAIINKNRNTTFMQFDEDMKTISTNQKQWRRR